MRVVVWTLRHGGDRRKEIAAFMCRELMADLVVVAEYRRHDGRGDLAAELARGGLTSLRHSVPEPGVNGVLVAARDGLTEPSSAGRERLVSVRWRGLGMVAASAPSPRGPAVRQHRFAERLVSLVDALRPSLVIGELKTAGADPDTPMGDALRRLADRGFARVEAPGGRYAPHMLIRPPVTFTTRAIALHERPELSDRPALVVEIVQSLTAVTG